MAKAILRFFGWMSIIVGVLMIVFGLYARGGLIIILPTAAAFLIAGAPLVALAHIVELLERISSNTEFLGKIARDTEQSINYQLTERLKKDPSAYIAPNKPKPRTPDVT